MKTAAGDFQKVPNTQTSMAPLASSTIPDSGSGDQLDRLALHFPHGLPGFETSQRFVLQFQTSLAPIATLQSTGSPDLCFLLVPVALLVKDYSLLVTLEDLRTLGLEEDDRQLMISPPGTLSKVMCLAILTVPKEGLVTANLLAPVVVNLATQVGVQAVRADTMYSHRHPVATLQARAESGEDLCW
jgi:flagellar assembly factor FliW